MVVVRIQERIHPLGSLGGKKKKKKVNKSEINCCFSLVAAQLPGCITVLLVLGEHLSTVATKAALKTK